MNFLVNLSTQNFAPNHSLSFDQALAFCFEKGCQYYVVRSEFDERGWEKSCALFVREPVFCREYRQMWVYNFMTKSCLPCEAIPESWVGNRFAEITGQPSFARYELAKCPPPVAH